MADDTDCRTMNPSRRSFVFGAIVLPAAIAGCVSSGGGGEVTRAQSAVVAPSPQYRVGDKWVYRVDQVFRNAPDYDETHEVTGIDAGGITVRIVAQVGNINVDRIEKWPAPGLVAQGTLLDIETRRFAEPLVRWRFPLAGGASWNQWVDQVNETGGTRGRINRYVRVTGSNRVTTPAGTFDAVRMTVIMRLDDEDAFRHATVGSHIVWYAPAVRATVREERRAEYREKGSGRDAFANIPVQNELAELVSFTPGR
jgi:hypothetical protein